MASSNRKTAAREAARAKAAAKEAAQHTGLAAGAILRDRWAAALKALAAAEVQVEKQVKQLMKEKHLTGKDASAALRELGKRLEKERKKAARELESRVAGLQARVHKERKALGRTVEDAVQGALGAFNIPSRRELGDLGRKVEDLARKIDRFKPGRTSPRRR